MARRTSIPGVAPSSPSSSDSATPTARSETGRPSSPAPENQSPRRASLTRLLGGLTSPQGSPNPGVNESASPLPLLVERERPRIFDMGPRMSNNYRSLGFSVGGDLSASTGVPLAATMSFETSGGTGALLLAKDPIHRNLLRHRGILKAYFLAHRDYIYETYGQPEDVELDDMALIYGQDCTSDWACAVTLEAEQGSKVEFEVFSFLHTGVWGEWKTACSASQRGPHRDRSTNHRSQARPDQTIVVKRLTIQTRRFRSMRLKASAHPRPDKKDRDGIDEVSSSSSKAEVQYDPLELVHDYLMQCSTAPYSMASDDDALMLMKLISKWDSYQDLEAKLWQAAQVSTTILQDEKGVAMLHFADPVKKVKTEANETKGQAEYLNLTAISSNPCITAH